MLVHVTRYVDVQNHVKAQVEESCPSYETKKDRQRNDTTVLLNDLRSLWENDFVPTQRRNCITIVKKINHHYYRRGKILCFQLSKHLGRYQVRSINGTTKMLSIMRLGGASWKKGHCCGGTNLLRGLTLEGLCVAIFVSYHQNVWPLMQMGRWFGYRPAI